jgi:2-methylisocitrate lyase-like PEP mutase family enzyme
MSKLGERIRRAAQANSKPIGFAAVTRAPNPSLLLAVSFSAPVADRAAQALAQGADTCLFAVSDIKPSDLEAIVKAAGDAPCGVWPRHLDTQAVEQLSQAGVDYAVFNPEAARAAALVESHLGYVLAHEGDLADIHIRTLQSLPLDAVFLRNWQEPLTVRGELDLLRVASLSNKPIMLTLSPDTEARELECLRDAGIAIVTVDCDQKEALEALPALRKAIDTLPPRRRRREERPEALLPHAGPAAVSSTDEEEEDDEGSW